MAATKLTFRVVPGARVPGGARANIQAIGEALEAIKAQGPLTAERVLGAAADRRSKLHACFEWDDRKAAHEHRLLQARKLIGAIEVVVRQGKKTTSMRAFLNVADAAGDRSYEPMAYVFNNPELADQVIAEARASIQQWMDRYAKYRWAKGAMPKLRAAMRALRAPAKKPAKKPAKPAATRRRAA